LKKHPVLWIVVAINLVVLLALAVVYPHLMVSPGPLVKGHEHLATDCFACHAAWRGASTQRCIGCHALADVGLKTTQGVPIPSRSVKVSFHQALTEQDCMACHSDHQGPQLTKRSRKPFAHTLLKVSERQACASCHVAPKDTMHRAVRVECSQCHSDTAWKPATFEHDRYFVLDRDHRAPCETCHKNNDFSRYTCYGCHEHSEAKVRAEHLEEGIRDFERCVECHRDPRVEPDKRAGRSHERRRRD
jgi:Class III cytochrome C family